MLAELLTKGIIRLLISYLGWYLTSKISSNQYENMIPEIAYSYGNKDTKKKKKNAISNAIATAIYFVPIAGTILLVLNIVMEIGIVSLLAYSKNNHKYDYAIKDAANKTITPEDRERELEYGKEMYKSITDSLKLDGLNDSEIKQEIKLVQKEYPFIQGDNDKEINKNQIRIQNLQLLDEFKDYLKKPIKAYRYTVDKKIEYADVDDDTLTIGVSKIGKEDSKMLSKKFKLNN